jgi:hypothetical protein
LNPAADFKNRITPPFKLWLLCLTCNFIFDNICPNNSPIKCLPEPVAPTPTILILSPNSVLISPNLSLRHRQDSRGSQILETNNLIVGVWNNQIGACWSYINTQVAIQTILIMIDVL